MMDMSAAMNSKLLITFCAFCMANPLIKFLPGEVEAATRR
jgi:hypothetical protein